MFARDVICQRFFVLVHTDASVAESQEHKTINSWKEKNSNMAWSDCECKWGAVSLGMWESVWVGVFPWRFSQVCGWTAHSNLLWLLHGLCDPTDSVSLFICFSISEGLYYTCIDGSMFASLKEINECMCACVCTVGSEFSVTVQKDVAQLC